MIYTSTDDTKAIGKLLKEWTGVEPDDEILWNSFFVVAIDDSKTVGVVQLIIIDDPFWNRRYGLVENVYVKKGYRGCGIGKQLMHHLENQAKGFGCKFIKLTSGLDKKGGRGLYKSLGYTEGSSFRKNFD